MNEPAEFGALVQGAVHIHELFISFVEAGFTEEQALRLTIAIMTASQSPGNP